MFSFEELWNIDPFSLNKKEKRELLSKRLQELTELHSQNCAPYRRIVDALPFDNKATNAPEDFPFLPVRLFKQYELRSVESKDVAKIMTSSGTSGQQVSKIYLTNEAATNQVKTLTKIASRFLGTKRLPMLIIDSKATVKDRRLFSARSAGILGFSVLGRDQTYALDDGMKLDLETVRNFLERHKGENILLFGFTSIVWEHFVLALQNSNEHVNLEKGIFIHGGGWKKLIEKAVTNEVFKESLEHVCGLKRVYNYYGMVEQTGSIFMECDSGYLHCSIFSDVIMRRPDFSTCDVGELGLVELVSVLPTSYPGHVLLSEDLGELLGEDDCPCGLLGKYFKIHGRVENAELRGCSDTY